MSNQTIHLTNWLAESLGGGLSGLPRIRPAEYQSLQQRVLANLFTMDDVPAGLLGHASALHASHPSVPLLYLESKSHSSRALRKL